MAKLSTQLVGDVKGSTADPTKNQEFLEALAILMQKYQVDKVDVGWKMPATLKQPEYLPKVN